jgi:uncharacterized membrane protein YkoI
MQVLVGIIAAGVALAAVPAGAQATASHTAMAKKASHPQGVVKVREATAGLAAQATVSADSAQKLALAQVPKGRVSSAELENEKGTLVYSYDVKTAGKRGVDEVLIDAKTGAVVSTTHETAAMEKKEAAASHRMSHASKKNVAKSAAAPAPAKP